MQGKSLVPTTVTELGDQYFGEGVCQNPLNDQEFIMLTWRENTVFTYDYQLKQVMK
jgi:glutamine cyclotransferase